MRKFFLIACIALAAIPLAFADSNPLTIRAIVPIDFGAAQYSDLSVNSGWFGTNTGIGIGAEGMYDVFGGLNVGAGAQYLFNREMSDNTDATFGYVPLYGLIAYKLDLGLVSPYAISRIGYGFAVANDTYENGASLTGGFYFTIGGGATVNIPNTPVGVFAEGNYALDDSTWSNNGTDVHLAYGRFDLSAGLSVSL